MGHRRKSIVAGSFYDADKESLSQQINNCFLHEIGPQRLPEHENNIQNERNIKGVISPHAGFIFSGPIAAHHFLRLSYEKTPQTIIIIGPNHSGLGKEIAIMSAGYWETPLGNIEIDEQMAKEIINYDDKHLIKEDEQAHAFEHSIEVQLPFLQFIYPKNQFKIIPICVSNQQLVKMKYLADTIFQATKEKSCLLIASSDFTHYENQESAKRKDTEAIDKIINMDSKLFYDTITRKGVSMCGPGPIAIVTEFCKKLGINRGKLLKYATSGDVSGMNEQVVGYASIIFQ